ncbi:MAG: TRAP transporter fused permease subunit [Gammaproteobacteria bacterium]|nr:TRAP transporter fused permease subunit [Gammaproteobacteria bacterium]
MTSAQSTGTTINRGLYALYTGLLALLGIAWILQLSRLVGLTLVDDEVLPPCLGLAIAAALLKHPYRRAAGPIEWLLGLVALGAWCWPSLHYDAWLTTLADRTPDKWLPGAVALALLLEAMRKSCGTAITVLVGIALLYGLFGQHLGGALTAARQEPSALVLYLYADSEGVPGFIIRVVITLVLAFILLGKLLDDSGATRFFTDLALKLVAHRRGGPAKVAILASGAFGMISGSTVGNIMSTGIVTIPLMKRSGFPAPYAGAIEAVASNGGQIAPPVMGATAFLIAEYLQIDYLSVAAAAAIPAVLYYFVVFVQVDRIAARLGLTGTTTDLPSAWRIVAANWVFVLPLGLLLYLLLIRNWDPAVAALATAALLLVFITVQHRALPAPRRCWELLTGSGENLLPIVLIGGGAGIVIGVLNSSGLGFQLTLALAELGRDSGLFVMLCLAALIAVILGMGMPTTAVYLVLSVVLAPALADFGVPPLASHLFLFYFGVLSMITPPVAVATFVAAGLAEAGFWRTSLIAMQLSIVAYLVPFLWIYNPALILEGSPMEILLAFATTTGGGFLLARALPLLPIRPITALALAGAGIALGGATVWFG